jgi:hypothetical protein
MKLPLELSQIVELLQRLRCEVPQHSLRAQTPLDRR